jgi:hypothetical protein
MVTENDDIEGMKSQMIPICKLDRHIKRNASNTERKRKSQLEINIGNNDDFLLLLLLLVVVVLLVVA